VSPFISLRLTLAQIPWFRHCETAGADGVWS
jgi:hypothetical protein